MEILSVLLVPQAEALPIEPLRFRRHRQKAALGTLLHHVMEAVSRAVRQACDKGVLLRQRRKNLPGVRVACDVLRHLVLSKEELIRKIEVIKKELRSYTWRDLETNGKFAKNDKLSFITDDMLIAGCDIGSETHYIRAIDVR